MRGSGVGVGAVTIACEGLVADGVGEGTGVSRVSTAVAPGEATTRLACGFRWWLHADATSATASAATVAWRACTRAMMRRVPPVRHRTTDKQALALLAAYLVFRSVTTRLGVAFLPALLRRAPWAIPLLNNSALTMIATGTKVRGGAAMIAGTGAASVVQAVVAGSILYWAGWRFGVHLAELAERSGSFWKSVWNPQHVLRAHRWLDRWGVATVVVARGFVEWMIVPVVLVAGSSRMHRAKFFSSYIFGCAVFAGATLWVGGLAGDRWPWLPHRIESLARWTLIVGLALIVLFVIAAVGANKLDAQPASSTTTPSHGSSENAPPTS